MGDRMRSRHIPRDQEGAAMIVACPCCKGKGYLVVWDEAPDDDLGIGHFCTHCSGTGTIKTELPAELNPPTRPEHYPLIGPEPKYPIPTQCDPGDGGVQ